MQLAAANAFLLWAVATPRPVQAQEATNNSPAINAGTNFLHLKDFLQLVLKRNESIQLRVLELEITKKRFQSERGIFEPELVLSASRDDNMRENTAEQRRSLGLATFEEQNNVYNAGLEALIPSGAKVRLGYNLRDLNNNLQDPRFPGGTISTNRPGIDEYQTFAGISLTQPLLKNFGYAYTLAGIRLAALASDIAYQDYRKELMGSVAAAEAAYWNLFMAQEQVRFFRDSVTLAESIVRDNRVRAETGKGSDLEVLEAEAGLALRKTKLAEAEQKHQEAATRVMTLYSETAILANPTVEAVDRPKIGETVPDFLRSAEAAFDLNPDYHVQKKKIQQEDVRLAYAKNQRLPQLDIRASYGLNGLGETPSASHEDIERRSFPSMSVGLELHVPLGGGIKARNDLAAAKLRKQQSLLSLKQIETQIINGVQAAVQKIRSARDAIEGNEKVVAFNQNLLNTQLERLQVGRVESRKVLEVEAALFESRNAVLESLVQYERAHLELELVQGATLASRDLDFSQPELQDRTATLLKERRRSAAEFDELMQALYATPPARVPPDLKGGDVEKARRILREKLDQMRLDRPSTNDVPATPHIPGESKGLLPPPAESVPPSAGSAEEQKMRRALREKIDQVQPTPPRSE
jgi:outer membrane protein TolC